MAKMKKGDDPKDFSVPEVKEHLKNADDEEKARVVAAEREADEPRKGIVGDEVSAVGNLDPVQAAGVEVVQPDVTSETPDTAGPVPPSGVGDGAQAAESGFQMPETHDEGERQAVLRTIAKQIY